MHEPDAELDELAHLVIGAAIAVHQQLGPGFLEKIYEEALCMELSRRGIRFQRQCRVDVKYNNQVIGTCVIDLLVGGRLVVELKAAETIHPVHIAQAISYLKAIGQSLGLLLNFQVAQMKDGIKRVVWTK